MWEVWKSPIKVTLYTAQLMRVSIRSIFDSLLQLRLCRRKIATSLKRHQTIKREWVQVYIVQCLENVSAHHWKWDAKFTSVRKMSVQSHLRAQPNKPHTQLFYESRDSHRLRIDVVNFTMIKKLCSVFSLTFLPISLVHHRIHFCLSLSEIFLKFHGLSLQPLRISATKFFN